VLLVGFVVLALGSMGSSPSSSSGSGGGSSNSGGSSTRTVNARFTNSSSQTLTVTVQGQQFTLAPGADRSLSFERDVTDCYFTPNHNVRRKDNMTNWIIFYDI